MSRSYPTSLEDVRGGELGNILAEMAACDELDLSITRWEQQLEQYQATVNNATPDSDMVAVAAAKAGIEVVRRAIDRANEELASHGADVLGDVFSDVFNEMWYDYEQLLHEAARLAQAGQPVPQDLYTRLDHYVGPGWSTRRCSS